MTSTDRASMIAEYGDAHRLLVEALPEFPAEMWQWRPAPGKWSIHEIIIHITDSEANSYIRCRRFIAEPGTQVMAYDENRWANELDYHKQSTDDALALFALLRSTSYDLIRDLPEDVWARTIEHPENGTMTMDDWLRVYRDHIPVHIAQMRRNLAAWNARA